MEKSACRRTERHNALAILALVLLATGGGSAYATAAEGEQPPNIVLIYADDLGYGDVGCYGAQRIPTPNIDRLARQGLRFTSGYATSATCTPSRYSMLTGEYAWRRKGTGVLPGDAALIIEPGRTTLASMLQASGYQTGVVGKWHLGLGDGRIDWNGEIKPGPLEVGFDESFIMAATGDRVPCVYLRGYRVHNLDASDPIMLSYGKPILGVPTGRENPDLLKLRPSHGHDMSIVNGISRIGYMRGGESARWNDEEMADVFTREAVQFLERHHPRPFFLYLALHDPHVPRVPHPRFVGKSELGPRGDAIVQADWCVGELLAAVDRLQLSSKTLVILTSDNGPVVDDGYQDEAVSKLGDHRPWGPLRGSKYSKYEAGTRVPFMVRWPGRVVPGVSDALVSQIDFLASFAELVGQPLAADEAPDSLNLLAALLGDSTTGREFVIEQGSGGLALRTGKWKYIEPSTGPAINILTNTETGNSTEPQLFDLESDLGERHNLAVQHPDLVVTLQTQLDELRAVAHSPR